MKRKLLFAMLCIVSVLGLKAQTWTGSDPAEGTFFLYNVGAGKFINVGDKAAGWGTNAYLTAEYGLDFIFEGSGNTYNLNSQVSNGGSNNYLATGLWCDGAATGWTFTKVDRNDINAYTIKNGDNYIVANAAGTDISFTTLSGTERDQWQIIGRADILANLQANTASDVNRTVATFFISDPDFGRNDLRMSSNNKVWQYTYSNGGNVTIPGRGLGLNGDGNVQNYGCEFWNNTFDIHQSLTNLPNGIYEFEIYGMGTNGTTYIYATTEGGTTQKAFKNTDSGGKNFQNVLNNIDQFSGNATGLVQVTDGTLTIGVKRENNSNQDWAVIDQARLYYYGDYTFAQCYGADLSVLITTAQGLVSAAPFSALTSDLSSAISDAQDVMENGQTEQDFADGQAALQAAVNAYNAKLTFISDYTNLRAIVIDGRDDTSVYTDEASATTALNSVLSTQDAAVVSAEDADDVAACVTALKNAYITFVTSVTVKSGKYFDLTNVLVVNPTVSQNTTGWTIDGTPNGKNSFGVCNYGECEFYNHNFKFYQTLALTRGTWEFGVTGFHRAGNHSTYFYAGDDRILIPGVASDVVNTMAAAKEYFDGGNGKVSLKFVIESNQNVEIGINNQDTETDKWTIFRDFTLKYYGAPDYSVYASQWEEDVDAANEALEALAYKYVSGDERTAVTDAIADAPDGTSKANYLAKIQALETATATFKAAAPSYNSWVLAKTECKNLWGSALGVADPTTAAEAAAGVNALNVAQYNKVADDYTFSATGLIGDFGSWTGTATVAGEDAEPNYLTNEHWSGVTHAYYEQASNGWGNANGWTIQYQKTCTLPAGSYVIKVAARSSAGTTSSVSCTATDKTITLPSKGARARGINTSGEASWSDSDTFVFGNPNDENDYTPAVGGRGAGWQWRFLPFTLVEETEVTMTFYAEASTQYQWMSIADGELLSTTKLAQDVDYDEDDDNSIESTIIADVTMARTIKVGYNTVCLPFNLTANQVTAAFGAGTVVYNYSEDSADPMDATVNFNSGDGSITANVPVLVKATAASTEQVFEGVQIVAPSGDAKVAGTNFDFFGTYAAGDIAAGDFYIATSNEGSKIYKSQGDVTIKAFRAYFDDKSNNGGNVKMFIDDVETSINSIMDVPAANAPIYTLAGQRVSKAVKGLYIVNGKKVVIK